MLSTPVQEKKSEKVEKEEPRQAEKGPTSSGPRAGGRFGGAGGLVPPPPPVSPFQSRGFVLQRKCGSGASCDEEEKEGTLQRYAGPGTAAPRTVPSIVHGVLDSPGQPLDRETRAFFEPRFGHDFGQVRVHTDSRAAESAKAVKALAYTVGQHIVVQPGLFSPKTVAGKKLLSHELTHVVQQKQLMGLKSKNSLGIEPADSPEEKEAEKAASGLQEAHTFTVRRTSGGLQRFNHEDCSESDLKDYVWKADGVARQMVAKAIRVLGKSPVPPSVKTLFSNYFRSATPDVSKILEGFNSVNAAFAANDYTYECEDSCDPGENAYTRPGNPWGHIHLCVGSGIRSWTIECIARAIIHEFFHKYGRVGNHLIQKEGYCNVGCVNGQACAPCSNLKAEDALDEADPYACFAFDLFPLAV